MWHAPNITAGHQLRPSTPLSFLLLSNVDSSSQLRSCSADRRSNLSGRPYVGLMGRIGGGEVCRAWPSASPLPAMLIPGNGFGRRRQSSLIVRGAGGTDFARLRRLKRLRQRRTQQITKTHTNANRTSPPSTHPAISNTLRQMLSTIGGDSVVRYQLTIVELRSTGLPVSLVDRACVDVTAAPEAEVESSLPVVRNRSVASRTGGVASERNVGGGDDVAGSDVTNAEVAVVSARGIMGYTRPLRSTGGSPGRATCRYVWLVCDPAALVALHEYHPECSTRTLRSCQIAGVRVCFRSDGGRTLICSLVGERNTTSGAGSASATQLNITSEVSFTARLGAMSSIRGARQTKSTSLRKITGPAIKRYDN